jgi:hypothetical protein
LGVLLAGVLKSSYGLNAVFRQFFRAQPDGRTNHPLGRLKYTSGDIARVSKLAVS